MKKIFSLSIILLATFMLISSNVNADLLRVEPPRNIDDGRWEHANVDDEVNIDENTENMLIHGDNLLALKSLSSSISDIDKSSVISIDFFNDMPAEFVRISSNITAPVFKLLPISLTIERIYVPFEQDISSFNICFS